MGENATHQPDRGRYIELVNWRAAQPGIPERDAPWMKLYTSLLDNDAFESLDDAARVLLIALWLYAAKSGRHIFPADPKWIRRKIPCLNCEPDLNPLLEARDAYGQPKPFLRIVDKAGIYNVRNSQNEIERESKNKTKRKSQTKPSRVSEKKKKEESRVLTGSRVGVGHKESQSQTKNPTESQTQERARRQQTIASEQTQTPKKPENPKNPTESEARGPVVTTPTRAPSSSHRPDACRMGKIPIWWSDPACTAFSYAVLEALGLGIDPESERGKAERGTYAAWLFAARSKAPASDWGWIQDQALAKAREIRRYGKSARRPGAVWQSVMDKVLCARAGPKEGTG